MEDHPIPGLLSSGEMITFLSRCVGAQLENVSDENEEFRPMFLSNNQRLFKE